MITFKQALKRGYEWIKDDTETVAILTKDIHPSALSMQGYWSFKFGDGYELCFEPLIWDGQYYVALYKNFGLLTEKVVIKPGYIDSEDYKKGEQDG